MNLIINADDCGISYDVDKQIDLFINAGKISSTTIMANMKDFCGALLLYEKYKDSISFGIHLNLTEGEPLLKSNSLVRSGHYIVKNDQQLFNFKNIRNRKLTAEQKQLVYLELKEQIEKLIKSGVNISHIDSHHHIHTDFNILPIVVRLAKEYHITKIRGLRNYMPFSINKILRKLWYLYLKFLYYDVVHTDFFTSYIDFYNKIKGGFIDNKDVIELECHPGHPLSELENQIIMANDLCKLTDSSLINYNEL